MDKNSFGELVKDLSPILQEEGLVSYSHSEPTSSNVLRMNKLLKFIEDRKRKKQQEVSIISNTPEYETPIRPIVIPQPNLVEQKISLIRQSKFLKAKLNDKL